MTISQRKSEVFPQHGTIGIVVFIRDVNVDEAEGRVFALDVPFAPHDPRPYSIEAPVLGITDFSENACSKPAESRTNVHNAAVPHIRESRNQPPCFGAGRVQVEVIGGVLNAAHFSSHSQVRNDTTAVKNVLVPCAYGAKAA